MSKAEAYLNDLEQQDLSAEYKCLNALQRTAWRVNKRVAEVLREAWDTGQSWGKLPPKDNIEPPAYPFDKQPDQLEGVELIKFREFKKSRNAIYTHNAKSMSRRIQIERTIQLIEDYMKYDKFYFVWQMDFRGRKYPVESFLSPQVADYGKACLEFADGMLIENHDDARYLAIHGANQYGVDKVTLLDRYLWVELNTDKIIECAENPLENTWWTEADKAWQFLAFCFEWADFKKDGQIVTRLPCASDGSCNGLQHLASIMRDSKAATSVNLTASDEPQDIYSDVAVRATEFMEKDAQNGNELARKALEIGIDRKITKRPVMIVPYAGTLFSCRDYIIESLIEKCGDGDYFELGTYIASHVWEAISEVVSSAREVMGYVQTLSKIYAKNNQPFEWVTPTNLLVRQLYPNSKKFRIETRINGSVLKLNFRKQIDNTVDKRKSSQGASPNFIHSLDASALTFCVNRCIDEGIDSFAMVHDSYATHSPNMPKLNNILREEYVRMYSENDVLCQLYDRAVAKFPDEEIPEPPQKGSFEISEILQSDYFFA